MSKIFLCSDTHFGHANIIRYCNRPFTSVYNMDDELITRWNDRVSMDDTVYFLGDFSFASEGRMEEIFLQLNFKTLFLILGNHDEKLRKIAGVIPRVRVLEDIHYMRHEGQHFVLCHYPMSDWNAKFHGSVHLHGHCHSTPDNIKPERLENRYDIGVDMYGGPVQLTGDLRYIKDAKGWN